MHAARESVGQQCVGPLHTALGELMWDSSAPEGDDFDAVMREMAQRGTLRPALWAAELPEELADAAGDHGREGTCARRAGRRWSAAAAGGHPDLVVSPPAGPALFGSVIDSVPTGQDAVRLWEAVRTVAQWPRFAELKRTVRSFPDTPLLGQGGAHRPGAHADFPSRQPHRNTCHVGTA